MSTVRVADQVQKHVLTDEAIDKIKAMIVADELAPGSRLPKEETLAGQLGLSRNSLREAVRALTAMRILITRQGDGTYVSSLEPHLLLESLSFAADVSQGHTALQLVQVRRLLEPQATGLAAALLKQKDLRELRNILDRSRTVTTVEEFVAHDIAFHLRIVEAVGNPKPSATPCCRCCCKCSPPAPSVFASSAAVRPVTPSTTPTTTTSRFSARFSHATPCSPPPRRPSTSPPWSSGWPPV